MLQFCDIYTSKNVTEFEPTAMERVLSIVLSEKSVLLLWNWSIQIQVRI